MGRSRERAHRMSRSGLSASDTRARLEARKSLNGDAASPATRSQVLVPRRRHRAEIERRAQVAELAEENDLGGGGLGGGEE
mmetsp:Transcript_34772/g.82475  ORF Transcript_34772/g.82475 Transcript_34772/m.82475 type:complete len:81 (+) Transcript_34772:544-786(+)